MKSKFFNTTQRHSKRFISVMLSIVIALSLMPLSALNVFAGIDAWNSVGFLRNDGTDSITSINWFNPSCMELGSNGASRNFNGVTVTRDNSYTLTFNGTLNETVTFGVLPISVETGSNYTISVKCLSGSVSNNSACMVLEYITADDRQLDQVGLSRYNFDFTGTKSETRNMPSNYSSAIRGIKFWAWKGGSISFNNFKIEIRIFKGTQADEANCNPLNMSGHIQTNGGFYSVTPPTREGYDFLGYWDTASGAGYQCIQASGAPLPGRTVPNVGKMILFARWAPKTSRVTYNYNDGARGENLFDASGIGEFTYIANGMNFTKLDRNGKIKVSGTFSQNETVVYKKPITLDAAAHTFTVDILGEDIPAGACVLEFYDANGNQFGDRSKIDVTRQGGQTSLSIDASRASQIREFRIWFWPNNGTRTVNNFVIVPKLVKNGSTQNLLTIDKSGNPTSTTLVIERINDTQIKFNGYLPSGNDNFTYLKVPFNPNVGSAYTLSTYVQSGSVSDGCGVLEFANASGYDLGNTNETRFYCDINYSRESIKTATSDIKYYRIKIWNNGGVTFNNLIVTPRIEKRSGATPANLMANNVTIGSAMPAITPPTRNGYNFLGFFDAASGGTKYYNADGTSAKTFDKTADTVLYAQWALKSTNSLAINPNGGVYNSNSSTTYINQAPNTTYNLLTPTRTAYDFAGWSTPSVGSLSGSVYTFGIGDAAVTANWTPTSYTISFDTDSGDALADKAYNTQNNSTLTTPTRVGSTFAGWKVITTSGNWTVGSTVAAGANLNGKYGNVTLKAQWTATSYTSKTSNNEFYYPQGTRFIQYLAVAGDVHTSNAHDRLRNGGYEIINYNLNAGKTDTMFKSYEAIYMGYKTTEDIGQAIRGIGFTSELGNDLSTVSYNGCTYKIVGLTDVTDSNRVDGAKDLNSTAGGDYIYAYATRDLSAGAPISSVYFNDNASSTSPTRSGLWIGCAEVNYVGQVADLNKGAGGEYVYAHLNAPAGWTQIDSTSLRQAMTRAASLLQNYSVYTESSVANLRSKLSAATPCYEALQSYAASTYDQVSINNLTNEINNAINALKAEVTLNPNGGTIDGSTDVKTIDYTVGSATLSFTFTVSDYTPSWDYHDFLGWSTESTATTGNINEVTVPLANRTVYAIWDLTQYAITYNLNGGTVSTENPTSYNIETASFTLNNPTRTGYAFAGWSGTDIDGTSMSVTIAQGSSGDREYIANWTANAYTVTFDANDGTGAMDSQAFTYGTLQTLAENGFRKDGYYFAGWATSPDGDVVYRDKQSVGNLSSEVNGEVTLYAVWKLVPEYDVLIPSYCGAVELSTHPSLNKYKVATVTTPATRQGQYFVYWTATYGDGTTEIASTYRSYSFFVTRDVELTPVYVANESEYRTERAKALIVSRITGFNENGNETASLLIEHSVSPKATSNATTIIGHGVIYTTNESYINDLNVDCDNENVVNKIARTSANNLSGLLEVNVGNASRVWAVPYIIDENAVVHYGEMKELTASAQTASVDEELITSSIASYDLTDMNAEAEEPVIEEKQPTVDEQFNQPTTFIEWIITIITTFVESIVAIINRMGATV